MSFVERLVKWYGATEPPWPSGCVAVRHAVAADPRREPVVVVEGAVLLAVDDDVVDRGPPPRRAARAGSQSRCRPRPPPPSAGPCPRHWYHSRRGGARTRPTGFPPSLHGAWARARPPGSRPSGAGAEA